MAFADRLALWNARWLQKPVLALNLPPRVLRPIYAASIRSSNFVPKGVRITKGVLAGRPAVRIDPEAPSVGTLLYLHGGGFVIGGPVAYLPLAAKLAKAAGATVWLPDYRLAPDHAFPAAPEDALACYRALLADGPVAVAGDSAGGCLALALLHQTVDARLPAPAALVLLSPATDLRETAQEALLNGPPDALLAKRWAYMAIRAYLGTADRSDPRASPIAAPFPVAPPTLVQFAGDEALRGQIEQAIAALRDAGGQVEAQAFEGAFHAFQVGGTPLANRAVAQAGAFLRTHLQ